MTNSIAASAPTAPPKTQLLKDQAAAEVERRKPQLLELSREIHANPELSWQEFKASARIADIMRDAGFATELGAYGIETAVEATFGEGDLTVAVCAEYDALPGIGHGCGHNVIATAGVGAALALASVADEAGLRVKLLGTPAEEHGGGKVAMLLAGAWEDVDFSLMVHGMTGEDGSASGFHSTAVDRFEVIFHGLTAHAAAMPDQGINAAAAATLALTAIGLLRQHVPKETNMNAFVSLGGEATNVIPDKTVVQVELRAYDIDIWRSLKKRVLACFEGAAIATGCTWEWAPTEHPYAPVAPDPALADFWDRNLVARGRTITPQASAAGGSTDMGNVSQVLPAIHPLIAFLGETGPAHNPNFTISAATPAADDAAIDGAVLLAWTSLDAALDPEVRADLQRRRAERPAGATQVTLEA
ncbi:putative amidohydrolase [Microlunatus phosphovorus NM-1]|uniref:Peptidase M20 domain-containing protein 2 n=1 Tax=Microlunatus phosphovorus (strain ATCC 700054 / DSM 10555 / JCM 9379 / NBRC 101784 / NCIMB 13414 / VKM Ac-1990 / NM-1) TaxID=1032480 RepID=F5XK76_MICPN|nr:amidohydrolase [Microlunatus phosphovorus]BAK33572.1 putative amidohydrolase [Microlunatus phosphovorus NM-1]